MTLRQLECVKALKETGSFSAAAQRLGMTQPALSLQIQKLEEELDFRITDRKMRPIRLTIEGELFYERALDILNRVNTLKDISIEISEEIRGELRIGIIPTVAPYLVPLFIGPLKTKYPLLQVEISEMKTGTIIQRLNAGKLDCGIVSTPVSDKKLLVDPLFYERFFAYVSSKHPFYQKESIDPKSLDDVEVWYLEEGNCFQNQVNSICRIGRQNLPSQNLTYRSSSIESLRRIVENESGITFVPELATINVPVEQEDLIKPLAGQVPVREISLVHTRWFTKQRQARALRKVILKSIPKRMTEMPENGIVEPQV